MARAALLLFVAGLALGPMQETDLFFRLARGDEILRSGRVPSQNLFSFTHPDHPDRDPAWLFDVGAAALYRIGGFRALVWAKAVLLAGVFAAAFSLLRRRGVADAVAALALAAAAVVMRERFVERPHVFSFAGEVLVLWLVGSLTERASAARQLATCFGATVLWANLHAGVFLAPLLLGAFALGSGLDRDPTVARRALGLAAVSGVAMLATPVGVGIFRYLAAHVGLYALHPVDEFRPPSLTSDAPLVAFAVVVGLAALPLRIFGGRPRFGAVVPLAAVAALASQSVRFGADFALVATPLLAARLESLARRSRIEGSRRVEVAIAALLLGFALGPRIVATVRGGSFAETGLDPSIAPRDAVRFVEDNGLRRRMYNDFETGAYLAWQGFPRHHVFVDPRLPAYPEAFHRLLGRFDVTRAEWTAEMDARGVETALLTYAGLNRRVSWWDPEIWALVFRRSDARVFVRRLPAHNALIERLEIPATFSFTVEEGTETHALVEPPADSPVPRCEWKRRLGDLWLELDGGRLDRALPAYREALAAPPGCLPPAEEKELRGWLGKIGFVI